jgi:large subunit ribosomal protein L7/L12
MDNAEFQRLRERVSLLEAQVAELYSQLGVDPAQASPGSTELDPEVVRLVNNGKRITAIKLYRERTGVGLKEASDVIEAFERRYSLG